MVSRSSGELDPRLAEIVERRKNVFAGRGLRPGDAMPALDVYPLASIGDLDGFDPESATARPLDGLWRDKPLPLVSASISCDQARSQQAELDAIAAQYEGEVRIALLYTIEAHPQGSACPYLGVEMIPMINRAEGILPEQPTTLFERFDLAAQYRRRLETEPPIYVDTMANEAWEAIGGGPNMAVLIDPSGAIAYKQSWLDLDGLVERVERLIERSP